MAVIFFQQFIFFSYQIEIDPSILKGGGLKGLPV